MSVADRVVDYSTLTDYYTLEDAYLTIYHSNNGQWTPFCDNNSVLDHDECVLSAMDANNNSNILLVRLHKLHLLDLNILLY